MNKKRNLNVTIILCLCVWLTAIFTACSSLSGNDKICYDLVVECSSSFKSPSSVRVLSGSVYQYNSEDDWDSLLYGSYYGYFRLSATNSFGATVSGYYQCYTTASGVFNCLEIEQSSYDYNDILYNFQIKQAQKTDSFDVDKVNEALAKKWKNY